MVLEQDFRLKWNNYHITVSELFTKLWLNGTFIDTTLILGDKSIRCHKVILSACSTYFEQILTAHADHQHPLIVLHDISFECMEKLVTFMYSGEVNVQQDQVFELLKVADKLKIKGLAENEAVARIRRSMPTSEIPSRDTPEIPRRDTPEPLNYPNQFIPAPAAYASSSNLNTESQQDIYSTYIQALATAKRTMHFSAAEGLNHFSTKRRRTTNSPSCSSQIFNNHSLFVPKCSPPSLSSPSPSPPIGVKDRSQYDTSPRDFSRTATPEQLEQEPLLYVPIKQEMEEETDNELQIDETAGQSPSNGTSTDSDTGTHSNQNTPVPDTDSRDSLERTETAHSLAAMASQVSPFTFYPQDTTNYFTKTVQRPQALPKKKAVGGARNGERAYTNKDLELGIELVISGSLTPALAIKKYHVPRRTFFRRLSAVRNERGIKPSKDGNYMSARRKSTEVKLPSLPSLVVNDNVLNLHRNGLVPSKIVDNCRINDEKKKFVANSVMSLLNLTKNNNFNYFLKVDQSSLNGLSSSSDDKENPRISQVIDNNSNIADTNHNLSDPNINLLDPNRPLADTNGTVEECS